MNLDKRVQTLEHRNGLPADQITAIEIIGVPSSMTPIKKRVAELEAKKPVVTSACHRIVVELGDTIDAAVSSYGADRIAPADTLIIRTIVDAPNVPRSPARLEVVR
jgi:hypothetical protein